MILVIVIHLQDLIKCFHIYYGIGTLLRYEIYERTRDRRVGSHQKHTPTSGESASFAVGVVDPSSASLVVLIGVLGRWFFGLDGE